MAKSYTLLTEIGATNARFALMDETGELSRDHLTPECTDVPLTTIIADYLKNYRVSVDKGLLATPGVVVDGILHIGNRKVEMPVTELEKAIGFPITLYNDLYAHAASLHTIDEKELVRLAPTEKKEAQQGPKLIIGIGTGLGMSVLTPTGNEKNPYIITPTEAGYMDLPLARTDFKMNGALQRVLKQKEKEFASFVHDHIPIITEHALSGKGLLYLYLAMCHIDHRPTQPFEPKHIPENATTSDQCLKAIEYFILFLGRFVRNAMITHGAVGGVYLTGGVVQAIHKAKLFDARLFREACYGIGRAPLQSYMKQIPIYLIKAEDGGVKGLQQLSKIHRP